MSSIHKRIILNNLYLWEHANYERLCIKKDSPEVQSYVKILNNAGYNLDAYKVMNIIKEFCFFSFNMKPQDFASSSNPKLHICERNWKNIFSKITIEWRKINKNYNSNQGDIFTSSNDIKSISEKIKDVMKLKDFMDIIDEYKPMEERMVKIMELIDNGIINENRISNMIHNNSLFLTSDRNDNLDYSVRPMFNEMLHSSEKYNIAVWNEGVGSGKTSSIFKSFLDKHDNYDDSKNNNLCTLLFITPQKSQMDFGDLMEFFKNKRIPLTMYRPQDIKFPYTVDIIHTMRKKQDVTMFDIWKQLSNLKEDNMYIKNAIKKQTEDFRNCNKILEDTDDENLQNDENNEDDRKKNIKNLYGKFIGILSFYINLTKEYNINSQDDLKKLQISNEDEYYKYIKLMMDLITTGREFIQEVLCNLSDKDIKQIIYNSCDKFHTDAFEYDLYTLIELFVPFEISRHVNSVILMTTRKSQHKISHMTMSKNGRKFTSSFIENVVGGLQKHNVAGIQDYINTIDSKKNHEIGEWIKEHYFIPDNNSLYKNIGFSIAYDEEHIMHNNMMDDNFLTFDVSGQKNHINITHAIAGFIRRFYNIESDTRLVRSSRKINKKNSLENEQSKFHNITKKINETFVNNLYKILYSDHNQDINYDAKKKFCMKLIKHFNVFKNNESGIIGNIRDVGMMQSICNHALSLSPKYITNIGGLKNIKLYSDTDQTDVVWISTMDSNDDNNEEFPTLYDMIICILCIVHASVQHFSKYDIYELMKNERNKKNYTEKDCFNQNIPYYSLVKHAIESKDAIDEVFKSFDSIDENMDINVIFTYFFPKMFIACDVYNLNKIRSVGSDYKGFDFYLHMVTELPEVRIMKMLNNKKNVVHLLSATRGFNEIFSGNICLDFFETINTYMGYKMFNIYEKSQEIINHTIQFNMDRASRRDIYFNSVEKNKTHVYRVNDIRLDGLDGEIIEDNIIDCGVHAFDDFTSKIQSGTSMDKKWSTGKNIIDTLITCDDMNNPYNEQEFESLKRSVEHAIITRKNSLIMTQSHSSFVTKGRLNNMLINELATRGVMQINSELPLFCIDAPPKTTRGINAPSIADEGRIYIAFLDSSTARSHAFKKFMCAATEKDKVIVIGSYNSIGTGLNMVVTENIDNNKYQRDFSSLYITLLPYYSIIKGGSGFVSIQNVLLYMKTITKYNDNSDNFKLKEIENIARFTKTMQKHHVIEIGKTLIQAIGRVERRNPTNDEKWIQNIYMMSGKKENIFDEYNNILYNVYKNQISENIKSFHTSNVLYGSSVLTRSIIALSKFVIHNKSMNDEERLCVENNSREQNEYIRDFFSDNGKYKKWLIKYRKESNSIIWFKDFNDLLRSIIKPYEEGHLLKMSKFIDEHKAYISEKDIKVLNKFWKNAFFINNTGKSLSFSKNGQYYTDLKSGSKKVSMEYIYNAFNNTEDYYRIPQKQDYDHDFMKELRKESDQKYASKIIPVPDMIQIIRGNVGEYVMKKYMKFVLENNKDIEIINNIPPEIYERYDLFYKNSKTNKMVAIDVKNWSLTYDTPVSKNNMSRYDEKYNDLTKQWKDMHVKAWYVNTAIRETSNHEIIREHFNNINENNIAYRELFSSYKDENGKTLGINPDVQNIVHFLNSTI